jgi:L-ascorbate metabolism protein UlaG (beta-lactamase superfamily)
MRGQKLYLKPNVLVEPLFNQWPAWTYLISPVTSAMYIANTHLKIMQSFAAAPQMHVSALQNPAMRGGPFINYGVDKAPAVRELIGKTMKAQAPMLELAAAIQSFSETLAAEANGHSLEPLYQKLPDALRGYVELVYDLDNNPSLRFIEGLFFKGRYYNEASQSVVLSLVEQDERTFMLSTPKLADHGYLQLNVPFRSAALDELFRMKTEPRPFEYIKDLLGVGDEDEALFASFFTGEAPPPCVNYAGAAVRIRYFGHACILIESKETSILFDPVIGYKYPHDLPRYTYEDLPETIDYVVITHNHQDHCMYESLLQLRHKIKEIVVPKNGAGGLADPSLKLALQHTGFRNVRELDEMETLAVAGGSITGLPFLGEHADLNIRTKLAYVVELQGRRIMCAADSNNIDPVMYQHIHESVGDVDVVFLGMECAGGPLSWLYGALLTKTLARKMDQSRRLDGSDCVKGMDLVRRLNPRQVYIYAMGSEPWLSFLTSIQYTEQSRPIVESNKLVAECRGRGLESERLYGRKEIILPAAEPAPQSTFTQHATGS